MLSKHDRTIGLACLFSSVLACGRTDAVVEGADEYGGGETVFIETGEPGDGEPWTGDGEPGDGEPWTGDGEPWGDGDGDPWTGDGEPWGDGDGDPWGDGDGDPWGDGDPGDGDPGDGDPGDGDPGDGDPGEFCGDGVVNGGEVCDDGVNDGSYGGCTMDCLDFGPFCGDGVINGPEGCDDQNADSADGCLGNCTIATSCLDIILWDPNASDGPHTISPKPNTPWTAWCDMTTDGGGWTAITLAHTCNGDLDSFVTAVEAAPTDGVDNMCRPFTRDANGNHTYYWDIEFPPGLDEFYIGGDYLLRANSTGNGNTSEISANTFVQTSWNLAYGGLHGDVSFGSPDDPGPTTSFAAEGIDVECINCQQAFPNPDAPYMFGMTAPGLRIGWGEGGGQVEGWFPWYSGTLYLR